MLEILRRKRDNEEGFTLIELMVVVLIIGILLAIAVPTFLSAQKNAKVKAATANLRQGLSAVKTVYTEKQTYDVAIGDLTAAEPSLGWTAEDGSSATPENLSWNGSATLMQLAVKSKTGTCFYIVDDVSTTGSTKYGKDDAATACKASEAGAVTLANSPSAAGW